MTMSGLYTTNYTPSDLPAGLKEGLVVASALTDSLGVAWAQLPNQMGVKEVCTEASLLLEPQQLHIINVG